MSSFWRQSEHIQPFMIKHVKTSETGTLLKRPVFPQVQVIHVRLCANGHNIVSKNLPTFLDVTCCVHLYTLSHAVALSFKQVKLFSQQLATFLLFCDCRSIAQQCWIRLHSSSNIVEATHAHYAWSPSLYPSHDALKVPTLLGVVASVCTPLPTCSYWTIPRERCLQEGLNGVNR